MNDRGGAHVRVPEVVSAPLPERVAAESLSGNASGVAYAADVIATASIWLPFALVGYFMIRALHLPVALLPLALGVFAVVTSVTRSRDQRFGKVSPRSVSGPVDGLLVGAILAVIAAPALRLLGLAGGAYPHAFLFSDEAFNLLIAQSLATDFPPNDLGYLGRPLRYHLGGPLLVEMVHRYTTVAPHTIFYGVLPMVMKAVATCSVFRTIGLLFPSWSTRRILMGTLAAGGAFLVSFYDIAWNVRNLVLTGEFMPGTIFSGMELGARLDGFLTPDVYYASSLAIALFFVLLANLHRGPILLATGLSAIFLAKAPVFLPIGVAWACFAVVRLWTARETAPLVGGCLAVAFCLFARSYFLEPGLFTLGLGRGVGFDMVDAWGRNLALGLHVASSAATTGLGLAAVLAGLHVYGAAGVGLAAEAVRTRRIPTEKEIQLLGLVAVAAALFLLAVVFRVEPVTQERFLAVHSGFRERLWLPAETYLSQLWQLSIGAASVLLGNVVALLATIAVFVAHARTRSRVLRGALVGVLVLAGSAAVQHAVVEPPSRTTKAVSPDAAAALASIPVRESVILSNDCAYDAYVETQLPLMNAWAPALYGHQFWACNFMFNNNFAAPDAATRLDRLGWFWASREFGVAQRKFLRDQGITHLLIASGDRRWTEMASRLDRCEWLERVHLGREYVVYRVRRDT